MSNLSVKHPTNEPIGSDAAQENLKDEEIMDGKEIVHISDKS